MRETWLTVKQLELIQLATCLCSRENAFGVGVEKVCT